MRAAFLHVDAPERDIAMQRRLAEIMIASLRRACPGVHVIQMTDMDTPLIDGVDESRRLDSNTTYAMIYKLRHLTRLDGEVLILDTDIVVQKNPEPVFKLPFDVALTKRNKKIIATVSGYKAEDPDMPYNTGVMFSRSQEFWRDALRICEKLEERLQAWWGDQIAVATIAQSQKYNVAVLPCFRWNYSPYSEEDMAEDREILHFKGPRKEWMLRRAA